MKAEREELWGIWCTAPSGAQLKSGWYDGAFARVERGSEAQVREVMRLTNIPDYCADNGWKYEPRRIGARA